MNSDLRVGVRNPGRVGIRLLGEGRYVLPVPATFVIDRAGIIRAAFTDLDYRRRVEPADILAALEALPTP
jgi:peroxiredoxin